MTLSELSVRRPVLITMVFVLLITLAILMIPKLEIALYPSVDMPLLSVIVETEQVGPEVNEMQVARILENNLGSVKGMENITSRSSSNQVFVMLEFSYTTNLDDAYDEVSEKLSFISNTLPDWVGTPMVVRMDTLMGSSILELVISGPYDQQDLTTIAEDTTAPLIERVEGVAQVTVFGGGTVQYTVAIDPMSLASYDMTYTEVVSALRENNVQGTGGTFDRDGLEYLIAVDLRYSDISHISDIVIQSRSDGDIRVKDVAKVYLDTQSSSRQRSAYLDGSPVVVLAVSSDSDANETRVARAVIDQLGSIESQLPHGVELTVRQDSTTMITSTMNEVYKNAVQGVFLAALIIFLFLRGLKTTIIIAVSMPLSMIITLMVMSLTDVTINIMSMSGLILGIGMIVDASIVILENTYTYREMGYKPAIAAILGSKRMFSAIFASTMTTLSVFIPLLVYRTELGMIGMMFQDLILTVCIALGSSLFIAVTLVPALSGSILRIETRVQKPVRIKCLRAIDSGLLRFEEKIRSWYKSMLAYALRHRLLIMVLIVFVLLLSITLIGALGLNLIPQSDTDDSVTISLSTPPGTTQEQTLRELFALQTDIDHVLPQDSWIHMMVQTSSSTEGTLNISLPDITEQIIGTAEIKELVRPVMQSQNPNTKLAFSGGRGPAASSSPIDIEIRTNDIVQTKEVSNQILAILDTYVPEAVDVSSDISDGSPRINVEVDKIRAADLGLSSSDILSTLQIALRGVTATTLNTFSERTTYDLVVKFDTDYFEDTEALGSLLISGKNGNIRLDSVATFTQDQESMTITRENKTRVNHVTASLKPGYSANEVQDLVDIALEEHLVVPEGVQVFQSGDIQMFMEYSGSLILIVVVALILVYAVMAAQFESLIDPLIIFASIPTIVIGVVAIHIVMDQSFSLFSIVGVVALIGVVVNNGIVLVDSINYEVRQKRPIISSCIDVAGTRLRPILMTTLTTVLGLFPLALFPGEGAELMQPIAFTVIGGLLSGALITLFQTPILYSILNKRRERRYDDPMTLQNQLAEYDSSTGKGEHTITN